MKNLLTFGRFLMLPGLLGCTVSVLAQSAAQSLGAPSSARAWVGRPLEMTVPARFADADVRDECIRADVFFGDKRLPAGQVQTSVLPTSDPNQKRVRISTAARIDEPVVTVSLRAGCHGAITRSYTLLPEMPTEQMIASLLSPPTVAAAPLLSPGASAGAGAATATAAAAPLRITRNSSPRIQPAGGAAQGAGTPARPRAARPAPAAPAMATGPRLRLDPLEADSHTVLRVTAMLSDPAGDAGRRATAAMLWQAINADPADLMRTTVLLQKLETDLVQLRQNAVQTRAEMDSLRRRMEQPQPWYQSAATLQMIALMFAALVATLGVLWLRARRARALPAWYAPAPQPAGASAPAADEVLAEQDAAPDAQPAPVAQSLPLPVPSATPVADGVLRVETLAATFGEVEFLSSLGLAHDAADVLKTYLQDSSSPAPLAFFELMRLCAAREDAEGLDAVRRRYAQVFGAEAPPLEQVSAAVGLENLPALGARITQAWGTSDVQALIEESLFGLPDPAAPLTLQAGRDLLCLHDIAMRLATEAAAVAPATDAEGHALAPWAHGEDAAAAHAALYSAAADAPAVDIDLDAVRRMPDPAPQPEPGAEPELLLDDPAVAPLIAEMQAAAREAEQRVLASRRAEQDEDAFSAAMASERAPTARL
jgi:pilus assembly protein FimV